MQKNTLALITLFSLAVGGCHGKGKAEPFEFGKIYLYSSHKDLNNPQLLPTENLPGRKLIDRYPELLQRQLLNRKLQLRPELRPWASTFFPTWFGGVSGRWQDSKVRLVLRTLWGSQPLTSFEAEELLEKSSRGDSGAQDTVYGLSPTEKYDYAVGDYSARSTREESLVRGHNSPNMLLRQPFWM
ncbi:MAG: hypothetical protein HY074_01195, partial [Deltaproteobacteria bacterium]|nr:hypothetical protein [Deltaproteobacteria bacterium]